MKYSDSIQQVIAVVVLYNVKFSESKTIQTLHSSACRIGETISLFIYDNSATPCFDYDAEKFPFFKVDYVHDAANPGISKAYNTCAKKYETSKEWILLLDQDTELNDDTLAKYVSSLVTRKSHLYIPKIFDENTKRLISPFNFFYRRGFYMSERNLKNGICDFKKGISFINSGALISIKAFLAVGGYDENLFDYSDHEFFERFSVVYTTYFLVNLNVFHSLSSFDSHNSVTAKNRYRIFCKSSKYYAKKSKSVLPIFWALLRGLKLSFLSKDIGYLRTFKTSWYE